jgi:hypothetical protein
MAKIVGSMLYVVSIQLPDISGSKLIKNYHIVTCPVLGGKESAIRNGKRHAYHKIDGEKNEKGYKANWLAEEWVKKYTKCSVILEIDIQTDLLIIKEALEKVLNISNPPTEAELKILIPILEHCKKWQIQYHRQEKRIRKEKAKEETKDNADDTDID